MDILTCTYYFFIICLLVGFLDKIVSGEKSPTRSNTSQNSPMKKQFQNIGEVQTALQQAGLESSNLILGIDFTKSNTWAGKKTFNEFSLHDTSRQNVENPYQRVMRIIARSLLSYDEDSLIPAFGFGDIYTTSLSCFPFYPDRPCHGLDEVLHRYNEIVGSIALSCPTNFAPVKSQFARCNFCAILEISQISRPADKC